MTTISTDDVRQLAVLSGLQLADDELDNLRDDLSNILGYIDQLSTLDTEGVEPTYQVTGLENIWRDDVISEGDVTGEQLVALAPESQAGQIKVPKVL